MSDKRNSLLAFGPFRLFPAERRLEEKGRPVRLGGRTLDLLIFLVERAGEVVPKRTLLEGVWPDVLVEESSLRFHIKNLRKVLGDNQSDTRYVTNVPGRGYCFVAPVDQADRAASPIPENPSFGVKALLPTRRSTIIGRADSIDAVSSELAQRRLVTIAGPAGIGKTTLAIAAAEALLDRFNNAVFFVDLAPIEDPALVVSAVASALGVVLQADEPIPAIVDFLRDRRLLIVLDNCEQVIESVAGLADRILRSTVGVHLLITSRETLRIAGEGVHRLMPLECPPIKASNSADEATAYAAMQLFVDRASARVGGFSLDDTLAPAAAQICRRLDGIPFAIELAAARVEFFGVAALARGLDDMFGVLTQGRRFALPRHQTLRATLDWGYNLLSPTEQTILRRIAVFRAPFTLESALAVVVGSRISFENAVEAMANLVGKSLLNAASTGETMQYRLLEVTRLYATEKLVASDDGPETARRHAEYHLKLIEDAQSSWESNLAQQSLRFYTARIDDVRAALDWSFSQGGNPELGIALTALSGPLWFALSLIHEYRDRAEFARTQLAAASLSGSELEKTLNLSLSTALFYANGPAPRAHENGERDLAVTGDRNDVASRLRALWQLAGVKLVHGDYRGALILSEEFEKICATSGDRAAAAAGDRMRAHALHLSGPHSEAERFARRALGRPMASRSRRWDFNEGEIDNRVSSRSHLARILWMQGFGEQAAAIAEDGLTHALALAYPPAVCFIIAYSACPIAFWTGNDAAVSRYLSLFGEQFTAAPLRYWEPWKEAYCHAQALAQEPCDRRREAIVKACLAGPPEDMMLVDMLGTIREELARPEAVERAERGESGWCVPEILRAKGANLLKQRGREEAAAEALFQRSLSTARQQGALAWQLRAATSLAKLWRTQGRVNDARDLLAPVYSRFVEGLDTADLSAARALLTGH